MKKNLLIIVPTLGHGGQEQVAVRTVQILENYYNITLLVFTTENAVYSVPCQTINIGIPALNKYYQKLFNILKRSRAVKKLKKKLEIDISYSFNPSANIVNALSKFNDELLISIHGYSSVNPSGSLGVMNKLCFRKADTIACVSKKMAKDLIQNNPRWKNKVFTLYNPYDVDNITMQAAENVDDYVFRSPTIVTMGRLELVKGFDHLLKAFCIVKKSIPDASLLILGKGTLMSSLKELMVKLDIVDSVVITGFRTNPYKYLAKSDLFVLSSINEGFPNALVEALACSLPVVATDCKTGPREILTEHFRDRTTEVTEYADYGVLVPPFASAESYEPEKDQLLAEGIIEMLTNSERYNHYKDKAANRAQKFSYEAYRKNIIELIESDEDD